MFIRRPITKRIPIRTPSDDKKPEIIDLESIYGDESDTTQKRRIKSPHNIQLMDMDEEKQLEAAIHISLVEAEEKLQKELATLEPLYSNEEVPQLCENLGRIVHPTAYATLQPGEDIASDNINLMMQLLRHKYPKNVQVMDTYFGEYLERWYKSQKEPNSVTEEAKIYFHSQVDKYTNRIDWSRSGLVLIPIHTPGHWILAVFDSKNMVVEIWDSFAPNQEVRFQYWKSNLKEWLSSDSEFLPEIIRHRIEREGICFTLATRRQSHQVEGNDCGAFICFYALHRAKGKLPEEIRRAECCNPKFMRGTFRPYLQQMLRPFVQIV